MDADRWTVGSSVLLLGMLLAACLPAAAADDHHLRSGTWRLETPLGAATGPFLMIESRPGETWRCEIAVAEDGRWPANDDLRHRKGRGWTLSGTTEGGFVQPWSEPWRVLGPSATSALGEILERLIVGESVASASSRDGHRRWRTAEPRRPMPVILDDWEGLPAAWRPPESGPVTGGALRRRLSTRGLGRGGDGLVLDLAWHGEELVATTARWPGKIELNLLDVESLDLPAEAYLPLWPLAEFLP